MNFLLKRDIFPLQNLRIFNEVDFINLFLIFLYMSQSPKKNSSFSNKNQQESDLIYNTIEQSAFEQMLEDKKIVYSHCQKLNKSGIMHNDRFLIMYGYNYIGYCNKLNKKQKLLPLMNIGDMPIMKQTISFEDITQIKIESNNMKIKFRMKDKKSNKIQQKVWVMKMKSSAMADQWLQKYNTAVKQLQISKIKIQQEQMPIKTHRQQNPNKALNPLNSEFIPNHEQKLSTPTFSQKKDPNNPINFSQKNNNQNHQQIKPQQNQKQQPQEISQQKILTNTKSEPTISKKQELISNMHVNKKIDHDNQNITDSKQELIPPKNDPFQNQPNIENVNFSKIEEPQKIIVQQKKINQQTIRNNRINKQKTQIIQKNKKQLDSEDKVNKGQISQQIKQQNIQEFIDWTYRFLIQIEPYVILEFKQYSEELVKNLIDEMFLPQIKRKYNPSSMQLDIWEYIIEQVHITVAFTRTKNVQVGKKSEKQTLLDESAIKQINNQFKNMNYLLQVTKNKGKFRVALANIIQYKGIVCLVRSKIHEIEKYGMILDNIQNQYTTLQTQSRIKKTIFKENQGQFELKFLNSQKYEKKSRNQNIPLKEGFFDLIFIDRVKNFLPQDLLYKDKDPINKQLRQQIVKKSNLKLEGRHLYPSAKKIPIYQENQKSIKELQYMTKQILNSIQELLAQWESLETIIISPSQLTDLFHHNGLNLRYLGIVYQNAKLSFIKKICMSEICSRCIKTILRFQLQEEITKNKFTGKELAKLKEDNKKQFIDNFDRNLIGLVLDQLNKVLGDSAQSRDIWKIINKLAIQNFHTDINKDIIDPTYFISCLTYHCGVEIYWDRFQIFNVQLFKNIQYFTQDMIKGFSIRTKTYNLDFTNIYKSLKDLLKYDSQTSKDQIVKLLQIKDHQIPPYLKLDKMYKSLIVLLSNFISPVEHTIQNSPFKHLDLYQIVDEIRPTIQNLNVLLMEIKWAMKIDDINYINMYFQKTISILNKWCGQFHIVYSQFYEQFATYYMSKSNYEQAITMAKTSIINLLRCLQKNSLKIADSYYLLGNIYFKCSKKEEAFVNYNKSKMIFQINHKTGEIGYSLICLKISQLYLCQKNPTECINTLAGSLKILQQKFLKEAEYEDEMIECYQMLSRSFQILNKQKQRAQIQQLCGKKLKIIRNRNNFLKILKILLVKQFQNVRQQDWEIYQNLYENFKSMKNLPEINQIYDYLQKIVAVRDFLGTLREYINNIRKIYHYIVTNDIFLIWKGIRAESTDPLLEFLGIFLSLYNLLGESFMLGAIKYQH